MKISKEDLIRVNRGFGGSVRNNSSLEYALELIEKRKFGMYKKIAYLWRAILVYHPFSDGNKRTAMYLALAFASEYKKQANVDLLVHHIVSIAKKNEQNIKNIEQRLKNAI
jgi:prophage maintenance system killer protein